MVNPVFRVPRPWRCLFAVLGLIAIANLLFAVPGAEIGASAAIFLGCLGAGAWFTQPKPAAARNILFAAGIFAVFAVPLVMQPGVIADVLAVFAAASITTLLDGFAAPALALQKGIMAVITGVLWRIFPDAARGINAVLRHQVPRWRSVKIAVWLMPVAFGAVFLSLFIFANPLFAAGIGAFDPANLFDCFSFGQCVFWAMTAALIHPFVITRPGRQKLAKPATPTTSRIGGWNDLLFGQAAILRALVVFNALFAFETVLDLVYLWGGRKLPDGLTYADYAHQGAYPLIFTALLAAGFAIFATRPGTAAADSGLIRRLVLCWVAQNILLVISSIRRLQLYVAAYSLTTLRLAALVWMLLVAAGLVLIIIRVLRRRPDGWLIRGNLVALFIALYGWSLANTPGIIAMYDVRHCLEVSGGGSLLDAAYLTGLGPQAIPALDHYLRKTRMNRGTDLYKTAMDQRQRLAGYFADNTDGWRGWNVYDAELGQYLARHGDGP